MPVYEYQCKACGQEFEYQQRMSDPDKTTCEACGGGLERLISRTAFQLKGSGWYKDLYSSSQKPASGNEKSDSGAASGSADKGAADKGSADKGSADKPAASTGSSSSAGSGGSSSSGSGGGGSREAAGPAT
jgi:putative FmdB family regulatory protein